jgi:hypothetical protein
MNPLALVGLLTHGAAALDPQACGELVQSTVSWVAGFNKAQVGPMMQAVMQGDAKRAQLCTKLGLLPGDAAGDATSPAQELGRKLDSATQCLGVCSSGSCLRRFLELQGASTMACAGVQMLGCEGGLPDPLQRSCDALNLPTAGNRQLRLGAVHQPEPSIAVAAALPEASESEEEDGSRAIMATSASVFLGVLVMVPIVAFVASKVDERWRSRRSQAGLLAPGGRSHAPAAAAASTTDMI